jgi:type I restriction enzyme S subunit
MTMSNIPKIRFKGYTNEWILKDFDEIFNERHQIGNISKEYPQLSFTIADGVINPEDRKTNNRDFLIIDKENKKYLITEYNDIIYNPANVVFGAIHRNKLKKGVVSPIYRIFSTNQNPIFMECIVRNPNFIKQISRRTEGTVTKLKTLKPEAFLKMQSYISPNLDEQSKIGTFLENVDILIKKQTQKIEELSNLKKSLLNRMIPSRNYNIPKIRFKGYTNEWNNIKLGSTIIKGGSGGTPTSTNPNYYNGEIPFLGIGDITNSNGFIYKTEKSITQLGLINSSAWIVPAESISLAMYASVGKLAILKVDLATSQAFYNLVYDNNNLRDFIYHRLDLANINNEWEPYISTGTQSNLNADKVKNFEIKISTDETELSKINNLFNNINKLIDLNQNKLTKLKELKLGLLDNLFVNGGVL